MDLKEVTIMDSRDFLDRHLSVTTKTKVKSVKDFDEASSKLIKIYGEPMAIITRTLIDADEDITPAWWCLQTRLDKSITYQPRVRERILIIENFLLLLNKLKEMSKRGNAFKEIVFHSSVNKPILNMVPSFRGL